MTVAIRPVVQRSVSKSQVVAPRRRRRGSCRCCAAVNFGGRPGAGFAVKAWRPRRRTASRQRITELCEHPSRRATSVTEAPAFSSSIPRRRRRSSSSGLPGGRMPQEYRARHQMSITYAHVNNGQSEGLTRDDILDNITITWLTNTALSGARLYWEYWGKGYFNAKGVSIPVAVSVFPDELYPAPRSWAERAYPKLIQYNRLDKGGHFAAWEQPQIIKDDVRAGLRS